jgi:catechol-2,3-dioxygenase
VFLRAAGGTNHHDLALFTVGPDAPGPERGRVGLYHLAWEVGSIQDLARARATLVQMGAFVGQSDHGATKSLYARDPDGNEFEVMWMIPRDEWGPYNHDAVLEPLDLDAELARWG